VFIEAKDGGAFTATLGKLSVMYLYLATTANSMNTYLLTYFLPLSLWCVASAMPDLWLSSQLLSTSLYSWYQIICFLTEAHACVNDLPRVAA